MDRLEIHNVVAAIKRRHGLNSQPQVARFLGVTEKTMANWLHARSIPDEHKTALLAEMAGLDPHLLLAYHQALRAPDTDCRERWFAVVRRLLITAKNADPFASENGAKFEPLALDAQAVIRAAME